MATVELAFTPLPVHVRTARLIVTAVARRSGVEEALLDEVRLAVGEACSRAVEAHRMHCPDRPVRLELRDDNGRFEVVVNDTASNGKPAGNGEEETRAAPPSGAPVPSTPVPGDAAPGDAVPGAAPDDAAAPAAAHDEAAAERAAAERAAATGEVVPGDAAVSGALDAAGPVGDDPDSLGLAVISGLVDDVEIAPTPGGMKIRMGWPVATNGKG
jgi:serine/threonine-protein kinase RsbW